MKTTIKFIIICLLSLSATIINAQKRYTITDYGVKNDSTKLQTKALQKLINKVSENGGGVIVIPSGTYLSGALFFKKGTSLELSKDAVLKGSDKIEDYSFGVSRMEGQNIDYFSALINADKVDNFAITGTGKIDGNGLAFWKQFWAHVESMEAAGKAWTNLEVHRPRLVFIRNSNNVTISGVKLHNAGFWTTHFYKCNNILVENADFRSPLKPIGAPSTDALDFDVCKHIIVRNCYMSVNDDAVTIKGGKGPYADQSEDNGSVEDVLVEGCTFGPSHGCITLGSECIHANNIIIRNCVLESANTPLLRLKLRPDTPQIYENISVENITGFCGELISMKPWTQFYDLKDRKTPPTAIVRNISFKNITLACNSFGTVDSNPNDSVANISFENCVVVTKDSGNFTSKHQSAIKLTNVKVNGVELK